MLEDEKRAHKSFVVNSSNIGERRQDRLQTFAADDVGWEAGRRRLRSVFERFQGLLLQSEERIVYDGVVSRGEQRRSNQSIVSDVRRTNV